MSILPQQKPKTYKERVQEILDSDTPEWKKQQKINKLKNKIYYIAKPKR